MEETASSPATPHVTVSPSSVVIGADPANPVEVVVTNDFHSGDLSLSKQVDGPGADYAPDSFDVTASCEFPVGTAVPLPGDGHVVLDGDGTPVVLSGIPNGAVCEITENDAGQTSTSFEPSSTVTIGDGTTTQVVVTNTYTLGTVRVTKALAGPGAGVPGVQDGTYTVSLACTLTVQGVSGPITIPGGAERTITGAGEALYDDLPTGAVCAVEETASDPSTPHVSIAPSDVVVGSDPSDPVDLVVTNDFHVGELSLSKKVEGAAAAYAPDTYEVTVGCEFPVGTPVPLPDDGLVVVDRDGTPVTVSDIPTGAVCTVAEADAGQTSVSYDPSDTVTIGDGTTTTLGVTNVYNEGSMVIVKNLEGVGAEVARGPFVFDVSCTLAGAPIVEKTVKLALDRPRGQLVSDPITGLPVRALCTVSETGAGNAVASGDDVTVRITAESLVTPVEASFTNEFGAGVLSVSKAADGKYASSPELKTLEFPIRVTCVYGAETVLEQTVKVRAGHHQLVADKSGAVRLLPVGARCWGTELNDHGATATSIDHGSRGSAVVVESSSAEEPASVAIAVVNTFDDSFGVDTGTDDNNGDHPSGDLPDTGSPVSVELVVLGALLVLGGSLLLLVRRRRLRG